jgi:hypothetical protein
VFSGHGFKVWLPVRPWQQLIDVAVGMTLDDPGEDVGEVRHRIDVVEFAGLDERSDGAQCSAPPSEPANNAFFRLSAMVLPL